MEIDGLYSWPLWIDGIVFLVLLLLAVEIGFLLELRGHHIASGEPISAIAQLAGSRPASALGAESS